MSYFIDEKERIITYKTIDDKKIDLIYLPPLSKKYEKAPVYFLISGGGWHNESKVAMYGFSQISADELRKMGWAVISIDYSVVSLDMSVKDDISIKEVTADVFDALNFVADNEDSLGVDGQKIVVSGHSAGAHLSCLVSYADPKLIMGDSFKKRYKIIGCAPISPITILYFDAVCYKTMEFDHNFIFYKKEYDDQVAHLYSPYEHINENSVNTLFIHGTDDNLVSVHNSIMAFNKGKSLGAPFELITPINAGHSIECMKNDFVYPSIPFYQHMIATFANDLLD